MKRVLLLVFMLLALLFVGACDSSDCTQCGFQPGEHIVTSYLDPSGAAIYVSGYADAGGCFRPVGCQ